MRHNLNHGISDVRLFETGNIYRPADTPSAEGVAEVSSLALVASGVFYHPFWCQQPDPFRFEHLKGMIETLFAKLGIEIELVRAKEIPFLHPGVAAEILGGDLRMGVLGELHPALADSYKFPDPVFVAELSLEQIYLSPLAQPRHVESGRLPSVERDLSFLIDRRIEFGKINLAFQALDIGELREFRLIDLYEGQNLPNDKVSLTVRLRFKDPKRTLTQSEVNQYCDQVVSVLRAEFGVELR
jgi:phenylalanyl-tRNA synthetase beta chain